MTATETLVCLFQQSECAGVLVEGVEPLRAAGPAQALADFREVVRHLRDRATVAGNPGQVDHLFALLAGSQRRGVDWRRLSRTEHVLTCHEQELLAGHLGQRVFLADSVFRAGRLEGVMPGRCLVTPDPLVVPAGNAVARFLQRTEGALPFSSLLVESTCTTESQERIA